MVSETYGSLKTSFRENNSEISIKVNASDNDKRNFQSNDELTIDEYRRFLDNILQVKDPDNRIDLTMFDVHVRKNIEVYDLHKLRKKVVWNENMKTINESISMRHIIVGVYKRTRSWTNSVNCSKIILSGDPQEILYSYSVMLKSLKKHNRRDRMKKVERCNYFIRSRLYIMHPLTQKEMDFPLAFSLVVYRDIDQIERLLRAVYRPQNIYCVHIDIKMDLTKRKILENIANCFDNVFIASVSYNVTWGTFSVLQTELQCMKELWSARSKDFYRWTKAKVPPPHKIRPIKGSVHVAINRHMVDFVLHDSRSRDFQKWLQNTDIPDETFFASLNCNKHLGINGSFAGDSGESATRPLITRYKVWQKRTGTQDGVCSGKFVRGVCVLGIGDLNRAYQSAGMFANKFHQDVEYLSFNCLEEFMHEKTWQQYLHNVTIDTSYYRHLDYVKHRLIV
ncbi:GCNT1-like protein [Mya arenaria]|uniref:GCNT1-like protein n=1 Tax=Mya arenaria TaxID=6604 RepID=A0ABY7EYK3_MYAAR|nr:GCNT1-like protein [Mya arenaria]